MIVIQICVGSSCHINGSAFIIRRLQEIVKIRRLEKQIELKASFCMGDCKNGVCLTVDGEKLPGVSAANLDAVFAEKILGRITT